MVSGNKDPSRRLAFSPIANLNAGQSIGGPTVERPSSREEAAPPRTWTGGPAAYSLTVQCPGESSSP